ncbi:MAG: hypothetical protein RLZZ344_200 [Pseudomonadota bacterium]
MTNAADALPGFSVGIAIKFFQRLLGIHGPQGRNGAVWFPGCRSVHTLWTRTPLCIVFLSQDRRVLSWCVSHRGGIYRHPEAHSVLEIDLAFLPERQVTDSVVQHAVARLPRSVSHDKRTVSTPSGIAMVEALIAAPIVLLLGLLVVQLILLAHGRLVVGYAAAEAARAAASGQVTATAIDTGLRRGLLPLLGVSAQQNAPGLDDLAAATVRGQMHYLRGKAEGWIRWNLLSPSPATLADWGQGAEQAVPPAQWFAGAFPSPRSGFVTPPSGAPAVGRSSGQSFLDAGVIQLQVSVGLPLHVPLAGPLLARSLAWWRGCAATDAATLGSLRLHTPRPFGAMSSASAQADLTDCLLLRGSSRLGAFLQSTARLPVRVVAVAQAQTVFSAQTLPPR